MWEPLVYSQVVGSAGDNLGLRLASEVEGSLVGLSPYPVESATTSRQVSAELSLIVEHPAGVGELLGALGSHPPPPTMLEMGVRIILGATLSTQHRA